MAVELKRGCGYRKIGATYLVTVRGGFECDRFPLAIIPCPLCGHRLPFTRTLQRIVPKEVLHSAKECAAQPHHCQRCPLGKVLEIPESGLMWVGDSHYTPKEFIAEADAQGVSKRIHKIPKWFKVREHWIFLAHNKGIEELCPSCHQNGGMLIQENCEVCDGTGTKAISAVFFAFKPERIERIIPDTMPQEQREKLLEQGFTLVEVPHDDPDHQPSRQNDDDS